MSVSTPHFTGISFIFLILSGVPINCFMRCCSLTILLIAVPVLAVVVVRCVAVPIDADADMDAGILNCLINGCVYTPTLRCICVLISLTSHLNGFLLTIFMYRCVLIIFRI